MNLNFFLFDKKFFDFCKFWGFTKNGEINRETRNKS
jgi:hypothetical protein